MTREGLLKQTQRKNEPYRRIEELEKEISVLLSCKNCPENKGGYICVKEYENKCLAQKIEFIKELEKENHNLATTIEKSKEWGVSPLNYLIIKNLDNQLTKAKEIIKKYYKYNPSCEYFYEDIDKEAEQFLKDSEVKK